MKEVVKHILQEETDAKNTLVAAKLKASTMLAQAQKETQAFTQEQTSRAEQGAVKDMKELAAKFLSEKEKILQATKEEVLHVHQKNAQKIREIAHSIFQMLITIE